jgi:hypothetical protein
VCNGAEMRGTSVTGPDPLSSSGGDAGRRGGLPGSCPGWRAIATALMLALPSVAAGSSFGLGLGASVDLPDPSGQTKIPPALVVNVPLRLDVSESARIRASFDAAFTRGVDTVSWKRGDAGRMGFESDAFFGSGGLLIGPEVSLPSKSGWAPYFGASAGVALAVTAHSCWGNGTGEDNCDDRGLPDLRDLFDPDHYSLDKLENNSTVNPFSRQAVLATDLAVGVASDLLWFEAGYSVRFVGTGKLHRGMPGIDLRREAYSWNAFRLMVGVSTTFGRADD